MKWYGLTEKPLMVRTLCNSETLKHMESVMSVVKIEQRGLWVFHN